MKTLTIYYIENGQKGCITTPDKWYEKVQMCAEDYLLGDCCKNQPNVSIIGVRYYRTYKRALKASEAFYNRCLIFGDSSVKQHSKFKKEVSKMKDIIKELISTYSIVLCGFLAAGLINLYIINF